MQHLKELARENNGSEFFATVFRLLQEQLGERLDLPASAITESVLDGPARELGASEELIGRLHGLFQTCNRARYAGPAHHGELDSILPPVEQALRELRNLNAKNAK